MARKRKKIYESGDRIQVSLSKNLSPEFLDWINSQSDLTNFFLYGAQQLYKQTGNIDVINILPRVIDINVLPEYENNDMLLDKTRYDNLELNKEEVLTDIKSNTEDKPNEPSEQPYWNNVNEDNLSDDPYS